MRSLGIRIGIVVALIAVGLILRPFISGNASQLNVGDCFDIPTGATDTIKDVQHHPCTDAHDAEVVFTGNYPSASSYPTDPEFQQYFTDNCLPAYTAYTGVDILTTSDMDMGYFAPTSEGWSKGDRKITCYGNKIGQSKMSASIKK
jgi:Septum formation